MKPIHALIALTLILACIVAAPVAAFSVQTGSHYSYVDANADNSKYIVEPPKEEIEVLTADGGNLEVFLRSGGCWDLPSRQIVIAPWDERPVIYAEVGLNGHYSHHLPEGDYTVVLNKGQGSGNDLNTWKIEQQDVHIGPGAGKTVTFIGAGQACGGYDIQDVDIEKPHLDHVHLWWWVYADEIHFAIENPNPMPVTVKVTADVDGQEPFAPFIPKHVEKQKTLHSVPAGYTTGYVIDINELFYGMPSYDVTAETTL